MKVINTVLFLILALYITSCTGEGENPNASVEIRVIDQTGKLLPFYSLQVIDVKGNWTGIPHTSKTGTSERSITIELPKQEPVILKFDAPGYQPVFTFLQSPIESVRIDVSLGAQTLLDKLNPLVVGDFNDFDPRSGVSMEIQENGIWTTTIESEKDTLHYVVYGVTFSSITGTDGNNVVREMARGFDSSIMTRKIKSREDSAFVIQFDPSASSKVQATSELRFSHGTSDELTGVAKIYSRMVNEYMNFTFSRILHQMRAQDGRYNHDFSLYISDLDNIKHEYSNQVVSNAEMIARLRFVTDGDMNLAESEAIGLLRSLSPASPVWMLYSPALTAAVNIVGLENTKDILTEIAEHTPYEDLAAEALYNIVRFHHQQNNEMEWYAAFFKLVSTYPEHFRSSHAYQNYAPEQPISEGKALPYNEFNTLDGTGILNLYELDESYLLLAFWATWCGPCIEAMPKLHDLHEQFKNSDFAIVSISLDEVPERVHSFRKGYTMPWYHGHEKQQSSKIREMGIIGIPRYILLGPDRTVLSDDQAKLRGENPSEILDNYLNSK